MDNLLRILAIVKIININGLHLALLTFCIIGLLASINWPSILLSSLKAISAVRYLPYVFIVTCLIHFMTGFLPTGSLIIFLYKKRLAIIIDLIRISSLFGIMGCINDYLKTGTNLSVIKVLVICIDTLQDASLIRTLSNPINEWLIEGEKRQKEIEEKRAQESVDQKSWLWSPASKLANKLGYLPSAEVTPSESRMKMWRSVIRLVLEIRTTNLMIPLILYFCALDKNGVLFFVTFLKLVVLWIKHCVELKYVKVCALASRGVISNMNQIYTFFATPSTPLTLQDIGLEISSATPGLVRSFDIVYDWCSTLVWYPLDFASDMISASVVPITFIFYSLNFSFGFVFCILLVVSIISCIELVNKVSSGKSLRQVIVVVFEFANKQRHSKVVETAVIVTEKVNEHIHWSPIVVAAVVAVQTIGINKIVKDGIPNVEAFDFLCAIVKSCMK